MYAVCVGVHPLLLGLGDVPLLRAHVDGSQAWHVAEELPVVVNGHQSGLIFFALGLYRDTRLAIMGSIMLKVHSNITVCLLVPEVIWAAITYPRTTAWIFLNPWLLLESGANIAAALWHHHVWVLAT